jgi:hypothetical protein
MPRWQRISAHLQKTLNAIGAVVQDYPSYKDGRMRSFNDSTMIIKDSFEPEGKQFSLLYRDAFRANHLLGMTLQSPSSDPGAPSFSCLSCIYYIDKYQIYNDEALNVWVNVDPTEMVNTCIEIYGIMSSLMNNKVMEFSDYHNLIWDYLDFADFVEAFIDSVKFMETIFGMLDPVSTLFSDSSIASNVDFNTLQSDANVLQFSLTGRIRRLVLAHQTLVAKYNGANLTAAGSTHDICRLIPVSVNRNGDVMTYNAQRVYERYGSIVTDLNDLASPFVATR